MSRSPGMPAAAVSRGLLRFPLVLLAAVIVGLTAVAVWKTFGQHREKTAARLQVIAELQASRIEEWLAERRADARFLHTSPMLAGRYLAWRRGNDRGALDEMLRRLGEFGRNYGYREVLLVDDQGVVAGARAEVPGSGRPDAATGEGDQRIVGPYLDAAGRPVLDFVASLGNTGAFVVLRVDPTRTIYPRVQSWPFPSDTGETLLFRRDGDAVLSLSPLRHRADAALRARTPIADAPVLAARMLAGKVRPGEVVDAIDYRGEPIVGIALPIAGTDWFLSAKLDRKEIVADAMGDIVKVALMGLLVLIMVGSGAYIVRQRRRLDDSRKEREARDEKLRALSLLDAIATDSTDAIFAKDLQGRYLFFNRAAESVTGKGAAEVLGRDDTVLFPPEQAAAVMANDRAVLAEGRTITYQERLQTAVGTIVFLATKGPLRDREGRVLGVFGISRDITERARADDALLRSNEELQRFNAAMVGRELEMVELKRQVNALARELGREPPWNLSRIEQAAAEKRP